MIVLWYTKWCSVILCTLIRHFWGKSFSLLFCKTHNIQLATFTITSGFCHANASLPGNGDVTNKNRRVLNLECLRRLDGRLRTAGSSSCLSDSLYFEAAAPETSRPRSNKQWGGNMQMFVPGPGWFSQQQQCWSPCGSASCKPPRCLHCPVNTDVTLRSSCGGCPRGCSPLARPIPAIRGLSSFGFFLERPEVLRSCFSGWVLLGTPQLDSRKFGILETGEIVSTPPAVYFFLSLSKENVIFTVQHTHSLLAIKRHGFYSSPARNMKHVTSCVVLFFFRTYFYLFFLPDPQDGK